VKEKIIINNKVMDSKIINKFPIREYLAGLGILPAKDRGYYGLYISPFREDRNPSMKVDFDKNLWIDYGAGDGGTLIDLVMRLERCDTGQAMRLIEKKISGLPSFSFHGDNVEPPRREQGITIENVQPIENPALITYLKERGIHIVIAQEHCSEVHYSVAGKPYYAVGFRNDAGGFELRNKYFKGCTSKAPTTKDHKHPDCLVFEGFMDYLSFMTLKGNPHPEQNSIILNSVTNLSKVKPFISSHQRIYTYFDNDDAGRKATAGLKAVCKNLSDQSVHYAGHNDLNAFLISRLPVKEKRMSRGRKL
jgi:hypothetical protein